ncbi:hypothetical protein H257_04370 [Aphanomyces astaci]|uniref:Uncharacterized protein n=1 Tax=Aphanomyces astaci TaxID=112090 RepID=W4GVG9_APHAT|nr:hypothetical protein H257_04370 [Aphanomyces astaci]ETV83710.1 hypothetical protein H257_04370 [Aphanomyces astaci]|eukprot:XP_009827140.1 hypothetical protein H257_04370 [Aphanomyces astaci]
MPFTAVVLDVSHREGEDNLLYATKSHDESLLTLRGMLAASAGACRTLFHECIVHASLSPDVHAAYVDDSDVLLVLMHASPSATCLVTASLMEQFVQRSINIIRAVCGPRGPKLSNWPQPRLDALFESLFRRFDLETTECMMHSLFPQSVPYNQMPLDRLTTLHGLLSVLPNTCVGRALFWRSELIHTELDGCQTSLVFECLTSQDRHDVPCTTTVIYLNGNQFKLVIAGSSTTSDPLDGWSLCALFCVGGDDAGTDGLTTHDVAATTALLETITMALPWPHPATASKDAVEAVAYDIVGRMVLSSSSVSSQVSWRRVFFHHVGLMRAEFAHAQTMHDMVHAEVVDQPHHFPLPPGDPLHDDDGGTGPHDDSSLLSSRWSRFRPPPILSHPLTQVMTRVQNGDLWIVGHRYATYELYALVHDTDKSSTAVIMELVHEAWDHLVAVPPTANPMGFVL